MRRKRYGSFSCLPISARAYPNQELDNFHIVAEGMRLRVSQAQRALAADGLAFGESAAEAGR